MEQFELKASPRQVLGKKVKVMRRRGLTPANIYGHGIASTAIQVDTKTLQNALVRAGRNTLISLKLDGEEPRNVFVRGVLRHPSRRELLHIDFYQVRMTEKMRSEVPLALVGESPAVSDKGGVLLHSLDTIEVESLPAQLPHSIKVDISKLTELDQSLHVSDLQVGEGVTILTDPDLVVAHVSRPALEAEEVTAPAEGEKAPQAVTGEATAPAQ